jgi:hypothetical protein
MPDSAYHNAVRKRDALTAEIERIQKELAKIEQWLGMWRELSAENDAADVPALMQPLPAPTHSEEGEIGRQKSTARHKPKSRRTPRTGPAREDIAPVAREIIVANGHPMPRSALLNALDERGLRVGGADIAGRIRNVGTVMWRLRDRFVNIEGRGYWPADVPYEHPFAPKDATPADGDQHRENSRVTDSGSAASPGKSVSGGFERGHV